MAVDTLVEYVVRSYLTASHDTLLCFAVEYARSHRIEVVYDAAKSDLLAMATTMD